MAERVFTLPEIAKLADAQYRTLKSWVERGLVSPSVKATTGTGNVEMYSERDAEVLCKLAECRRRGLGMEQLEVVAEAFATSRVAPCPVCSGALGLSHLLTQPVNQSKSKEVGE